MSAVSITNTSMSAASITTNTIITIIMSMSTTMNMKA